MSKPEKSLFENISQEREMLEERGMRYSVNDVGNSDRFIDQNRDVKFINEFGADGWHRWDGTKYAPTGKAILGLGTATARTIYDEAKNCADTTGRNLLTKWAQTSMYRCKIEDMLKLAAGRAQVSVNKFDNDLLAINCRNGVVELANGDLIPHSVEQMNLKRVEASYTPGKKSELWEKFLSDIFLGDKELIHYVKVALGYSLTGTTREHKLFICYGSGQNGKSTLLETILEIVGDYGRVAEFEAFLVSDKSSNSRSLEATGALRGARFAVASETNNSKRWDEAMVKRLTGGDKLRGSRLHNASYEFNPTHHLWFMANHLPSVRDASESFWRRPEVIPFKARFPESSRDAKLKEKLLGERDAIFTWLIEGALKYVESGLPELPQVCKDAKDKYRYDNDYLSSFIEEKLVKEAGAIMPATDVYELYQQWCFANSIHDTLQRKYFTANMEERGIIRGPRKNYGETFMGVRKKRPDFLEAVADNDNSPTASGLGISNFGLMKKIRTN
jgi:putative DNA primase/helicase